MNEFFPQSAVSAPTLSPDDQSFESSSRPGSLAVAFGHFLSFGLLGQILFTFLIFHIPRSHHGQTKIPNSPGDTLMSLALCLPLVFAIAGVMTARWKPLHWLGYSASIALIVVAIGVLGAFDVVMLMIWSFAGYC